MTVYGYARVSTDGQTLAAQEGELTAAGAAKVYAEKVSGAVDRPGRAWQGAQAPAARRYADRYAPGPAGAIYPRPVEHPRYGCEGRR